MRIISGIWRGHPLRVPKGVRATTDRVRESIFSILGSADGLRILDLYAGSGSLGIEALSRGGISACFVDNSRKSLDFIAQNLEGKGSENSQLIKSRVIDFLKRVEKSYDWIFCDPPYSGIDFETLIRAIAASCAVCPETTIILETDKFHPLSLPEGLTLIDKRIFGDTVIHFIKENERPLIERQRA